MTSIPIKSGEQATIEIYTGTSKKTGKEFQCVRVRVGKWSTLVFTKSTFELDYLKEQLGE